MAIDIVFYFAEKIDLEEGEVEKFLDFFSKEWGGSFSISSVKDVTDFQNKILEEEGFNFIGESTFRVSLIRKEMAGSISQMVLYIKEFFKGKKVLALHSNESEI